MSSTSDSPCTRRRRRRRRVAQQTRCMAIDADPESFLLAARLSLRSGTEEDQAIERHHALEALDPVSVRRDGDWVIASFLRPGPTAEIAAWTLLAELETLPAARVDRMEATPFGGLPELVLARVGRVAPQPD